MLRMIFSLAFACILVAGAGCAMCDNPYDYSYGAYGGGCADGSCGSRAGSTFVAPGAMTPVPDQMMMQGQPNGATMAPPKLGP